MGTEHADAEHVDRHLQVAGQQGPDGQHSTAHTGRGARTRQESRQRLEGEHVAQGHVAAEGTIDQEEVGTGLAIETVAGGHERHAPGGQVTVGAAREDAHFAGKDEDQSGTGQGVVGQQLSRLLLDEAQDGLPAVRIILANKMLIRIFQSRNGNYASHVSHKHKDYNRTSLFLTERRPIPSFMATIILNKFRRCQITPSR